MFERKKEDDLYINHLLFKSSPGNVLLSHEETPYYHRRCAFSLPSSIWDRVVPTRYGRQKKRI